MSELYNNLPKEMKPTWWDAPIVFVNALFHALTLRIPSAARELGSALEIAAERAGL